jgi:hypothetical protein
MSFPSSIHTVHISASGSSGRVGSVGSVPQWCSNVVLAGLQPARVDVGMPGRNPDAPHLSPPLDMSQVQVQRV